MRVCKNKWQLERENDILQCFCCNKRLFLVGKLILCWVARVTYERNGKRTWRGKELGRVSVCRENP